MVHSGSRGMGQAITAHHLKKAREVGQIDKLVRFDAESAAGRHTSATSPGQSFTLNRID